MESSAPALSESPLTFIPMTILRGAMVLQIKWNLFCGHPVYIILYLPDLKECKGPEIWINDSCLPSAKVNVRLPCMLSKVDRLPARLKRQLHVEYERLFCLQIVQTRGNEKHYLVSKIFQVRK